MPSPKTSPVRWPRSSSTDRIYFAPGTPFQPRGVRLDVNPLSYCGTAANSHTGFLTNQGAVILVVQAKHPTVLLLDDDAETRSRIVPKIDAAGFKVIEVSRSEDALEVLGSQPDVCLLFSSLSRVAR
jgi:hypothetical protein